MEPIPLSYPPGFSLSSLSLLFIEGAVICGYVQGMVGETKDAQLFPLLLGTWLYRDPNFCLVISLWEEICPYSLTQLGGQICFILLFSISKTPFPTFSDITFISKRQPSCPQLLYSFFIIVG